MVEYCEKRNVDRKKKEMAVGRNRLSVAFFYPNPVEFTAERKTEQREDYLCEVIMSYDKTVPISSPLLQ